MAKAAFICLWLPLMQRYPVSGFAGPPFRLLCLALRPCWVGAITVSGVGNTCLAFGRSSCIEPCNVLVIMAGCLALTLEAGAQQGVAFVWGAFLYPQYDDGIS